MNACSSTRMHGASPTFVLGQSRSANPPCVWSAAAVRNSSFLTHVPSQTGQPRGSGGNSFAGLVRDRKGNFYGATSVGGSARLGTVYQLSLTFAGRKESAL